MKNLVSDVTAKSNTDFLVIAMHFTTWKCSTEIREQEHPWESVEKLTNSSPLFCTWTVNCIDGRKEYLGKISWTKYRIGFPKKT